MSREIFSKTWSLGIEFDPTQKDFPDSIDESFFIIKNNNEEIIYLSINQGIYLVSVDSSFGVKIELDINDLDEGTYEWEINIIRNKKIILSDSGKIIAEGTPTKQKIARPWDLLNPNTEYVGKEISNKRLSICKSCDMFLKGICKECGCYMPIKTKISHAFCPIGKWEAESA